MSMPNAYRHTTYVPLFVRLLITVDGGRLVFCYFSFKSRHIIVWRPAVFVNRSVVPVHGGGMAAPCRRPPKDLLCTLHVRGVNSPVVI